MCRRVLWNGSKGRRPGHGYGSSPHSRVVRSLDRMIEQYRAETNRRRLELAMEQWRVEEAQHALAELEKPPERIH